MSLCAKLVNDGLPGWRLPTKDELVGAYEHGIGKAATEHWLTFTQMENKFWSSSTYSTFTDVAWIVNPAYGYTYNYYYTKNDPLYVSCVR